MYDNYLYVVLFLGFILCGFYFLRKGNDVENVDCDGEKCFIKHTEKCDGEKCDKETRDKET